ncbi:MAG: hypothetical protein J6Z45_01195 [Oscillospiraceae bacterium]|nr:hypothetical protein [Oscillospiraceae bacterium]
MAKSRRRKSVGTVAIPFMVTFLIALIALGGTGYYFYQKLTNKQRELIPIVSATASISDADINEILFVLDPNDKETQQPAVMLLRFDPVRKQEFCLGIPLTLQLDHEGKQESVGTCFTNHGINTLKNDLSKLLDQKIDRYMQFDSTGFQKMMAMLNNVSFPVTIRDKGIRPSEVSVELEGSQFETLLTSKKYSTERERNSVIGMSCAQLIRQIEGERIAANLDNYFSTLINSVKTDINVMDFSQHRHAISYVFEHGNGVSRGVTLDFSNSDDNALILEPAFVESLKYTFSQKSDDES